MHLVAVLVPLRNQNNMRLQLRLFLTALLSVSILATAVAADKGSPAPATYLITNDDGALHNNVSFFAPGGSQGSSTLTFSFDINSGGIGIGGGYFGLPRLAMLPRPSPQCVYASNGGSGDISGINIQTHLLTGNFTGSEGDAGDAMGIGVVQNANYLYAGYSASNTIGTFAIQAGCQLSFLGDVPAAGLNGGSVSGMALHGNLLVLAYADGSIESFNIANGMPVSNGDAQNSSGYNQNNIAFPDGVDITADGHYAIFGDSAVNIMLEVSDISSGHLTTTVPYTLGGSASAVGPSVRARLSAINSGAVRLSPDQSMIYVANNEIGSVTAAFFNAQTGTIGGGCNSPSLIGYYNPWAFTGSVATRDNTGNGGVLYVSEYGYNGSYLGVLTITSNGTLCALTETSGSGVQDLLSDGLLSITTYPPRQF
jgi:hypothetical protein